MNTPSITELQADLREAEEGKVLAQSQLLDTQAQVAQLEQQLAEQGETPDPALRTENEELKTEIVSLLAENKKMRKENTARNLEIFNLQASHKEVREERDAHQDLLEAICEKAGIIRPIGITALPTFVDEIIGDLKAVKRSRSDLETALDNEVATVKKLEEAESTNAENVRKLTKEKRALEAQLESYKDAASNVDECYQKDLAEVEKARDAAVVKVTSQEQGLLAAQTRIMEGETVIAEVQGQREEILASYNRVQAELKEANQQIERILNEANQLRGDYASLQEEYGELDGKYQQLVKEVARTPAEAVDEEVSELKELLEASNRTSFIRKLALDQALTNWEADEERLGDAFTIIAELKRDLKEANEAAGKQQRRIESLTEQRDTARKELQELKPMPPGNTEDTMVRNSTDEEARIIDNVAASLLPH